MDGVYIIRKTLLLHSYNRKGTQSVDSLFLAPFSPLSVSLFYYMTAGGGGSRGQLEVGTVEWGGGLSRIEAAHVHESQIKVS